MGVYGSMKTVSIVVYTNPKTLKHKQQDCCSKAGMECFWQFRRFPKRLREAYLEKLKEEWGRRYREAIAGDPQPPAPAPLTIYDFLGRIYFAVKGEVVGSFAIEMVEEEDKEVIFHSETWRKIEQPIPCKPFRGFRYKWWD